MDPVILDPVIPYIGPIGEGCFSSKKLVKLEGAIPPHAYGFDINLQCGPKTYPHDDIALQISARFLNGHISLNSSQKGIWGKEIRLYNVPIIAGQKFKISVLREVNQYKVKVAINDEHYFFPQRIPCEKVSHLSIDGDVSITRISYESINQFDDVQHSDIPPSYNTAMNSSEDVESQNGLIAHISIFHFRYNRGSPLKAALKNGCKSFFIFLCVIAVTILFGFFIFLIAKYANNDTGDTSYSTYGIPSIDIEAINKDMQKDFKAFDDIMARQKKRDEENKMFNDIKMDKRNKDYFDFVRKSMLNAKNNKVFYDILANSKKIDESNTFVYDFGQSPDLVERKKKKINDLLAKLKQNKLILATNSSRLG